MKPPLWVDREACLAIQEMMLAHYGGLAGVRDDNALESALAKPQNLLVYGSPRLVDLAASYAAGIIHNHPFLDGNKRTAFMVAAVFLEMNGSVLSATEESVVQNTLARAAGHITESEYSVWLKDASRKRR